MVTDISVHPCRESAVGHRPYALVEMVLQHLHLVAVNEVPAPADSRLLRYSNPPFTALGEDWKENAINDNTIHGTFSRYVSECSYPAPNVPAPPQEAIDRIVGCLAQLKAWRCVLQYRQPLPLGQGWPTVHNFMQCVEVDPGCQGMRRKGVRFTGLPV